MKKQLNRWYLVSLLACLSTTAAAVPEKVVSTSGNASETVVALGLENRLIAVDTTSILPPDIMRKKPKIGYRRQLSAEGILSMAPDLVILAPDSGPHAVIKQLEAAGTPLFYLQDKQTLAGIAEDTARLGEVLGVPEAAAKLVEQQEKEAQKLANIIAAYPHPPKLVILLDPGRGQSFALGKGTSGEHLATILGGTLSWDIEGIKPVSDEVLATDKADAILIAARETAEDLTDIQPLTVNNKSPMHLHPAAAKHCIFSVNIVKALGFGPDTAQSAQAIARAIKPCLATAATGKEKHE